MINELEKMSEKEKLIVDIELSAHSISGAVCSMRKSMQELGGKDFFIEANINLQLIEENLESLEFKMWKFSKRNGGGEK